MKNNLRMNISIYKPDYYMNSIIDIQRYVRKKLSRGNFLCPITLSKPEYPFISLKSSNGVFRYFSLENLVKYLNKSELNINPLTRELIDEEKINDINKLCEEYDLDKILLDKHNTFVPTMDQIIILCSLKSLIDSVIDMKKISKPYVDDFLSPQILTYIYYLFETENSLDKIKDIVKNTIDKLKENKNKYVINMLRNINYVIIDDRISRHLI